MTSLHEETVAALQRANAALAQGRDTALAREAALAEVLDSINLSPGDLKRPLQRLSPAPAKTEAWP